jgi:Xaa-Pro aminopeptidase
LREGDLVITEFHASYGGYLTAAEFSVFVGDPPRALLDLHEIAVECLNEGFGSFRPGVTLRELLEAIRKPAARAGVDYVELGFHGHGLASPEFPAIVHKPNTDIGVAIRATGSRIGDLELKPGMVFGTNIDIHKPGWKPDVGVMLGDTVLVTESGPRRLVEVPTVLPCVR